MLKDPEQGGPHAPPAQPGQPTGEEGRGSSGAACFLNSASVSLFPPLASVLPAPVSPWVSGGGKARVFAKLMICLCAKRTGGWTSTQTPLMAARPLCWRPRSPALAPCRLQPLPTPTPAAPAPRSTPEPPPPQPRVLGTKSGAPFQPPQPPSSQPWFPLGEPLWPPWAPPRHGDSPPRGFGEVAPLVTAFSTEDLTAGQGGTRCLGT